MSLASTISDDKPWRPYLVEEKEGTEKIILRRVLTQGERKRQTDREREREEKTDRQTETEGDRQENRVRQRDDLQKREKKEMKKRQTEIAIVVLQGISDFLRI